MAPNDVMSILGCQGRADEEGRSFSLFLFERASCALARLEHIQSIAEGS